jgi:glycosyltransferase involved in cell wall biosynthesis
LSDVIAVSDLVISIFSTVLLEAIAKNVVPLICSIGAIRQYEPPIAELGAAIEVQSTEDALRVIDEVIADPKRLTAIRNAMAAISGEFFFPNGSAKTIAALVENVRYSSHL